jgi:hypothetical protein
LTPEVQLLCHVGYEPDANDRRDVAALSERFGLIPPAEYSTAQARHTPAPQ